MHHQSYEHTQQTPCFSTDIVDGQVKTADLAAAAVTAPKLATNSVNSAKVADGTITAADIATNAVGAAEIAANIVGSEEIGTDAVGAAELAGVTQLVFSRCPIPSHVATLQLGPGIGTSFNCNMTGVDTDDQIIASLNDTSACFSISQTDIIQDGLINVSVRNNCSISSALGAGTVALIGFDTTVDSKT